MNGKRHICGLVLWLLAGCTPPGSGTPPPDGGSKVPGGHTYKLRIGQDLEISDQRTVGNLPETGTAVFPVVLQRFLGQEPIQIGLAFEMVSGEPSHWQIVMDTTPFQLGAALSASLADVDADGDIDFDDKLVFDSCYSAGGVPTNTCIRFDFDNDQDVDDADLETLNEIMTGPQVPRGRYQRQIGITALPQTPENEQVRVQITATSDAGESHQVYAYVTKQSFGLALDVLTRADVTMETKEKLIFGYNLYFDLGLRFTGADSDTVTLSSSQAPGFLFDSYDGTGNPLSSFPLAAEGLSSSPDAAPAGRLFRFYVTPPITWNTRASQSVTLTAQGDGGYTSDLDLNVIQTGGLWTPSDLMDSGGRRHLVRPGSVTTFLLKVINPLPLPLARTFTLSVAPSSAPGWTCAVARSQLTLDPYAQDEVKATIHAPADAALGSTADFDITLSDGEFVNQTIRVGAEASGNHKVIFLAIDGLQPEYMYLNAKATGPGAAGDWLMPNLQEAIATGTNYVNAYCALPSATDMNHFNALAGTKTGTCGVPSVFYFYYGKDADGVGLFKQVDAMIPRYGPQGERVLTAFDMVKQAYPHAYTAIFPGKPWVGYLVAKPTGGADLIANGQIFPPYIDRPRAYTMGDPPSDMDAAQDPPPKWQTPNWGAIPGFVPYDRWMGESAMRVIDNEDPDFIYLLLAHTDEIQHLNGCAYDASEWDDRGTETLWDDVNLINPLASREDVIDIVREADSIVGELIAHLTERGTLDQTNIFIFADHGFQTEERPTIDLRAPLEQGGFGFKDDFEVYAGSYALLYAVNPEDRIEMERLLENAHNTVAGVEPGSMIVMNREEMKTGMDTYTGRRLAEPHELYSEFYAEHEVPGNDQQKWPDFLVFFLNRTRALPVRITGGESESNTDLLFVASHGGPDTQHIPLIARGPGVPAGRVISDTVSISDIVPTIGRLEGWTLPPSVDGRPLPGIAADQ